jgi:hypothetical protein
MKGWKERACAALKNARLWAGGDIRTEALNLIAEYETHHADKRKAREAVDLDKHEDGFDRDDAASDEVDTMPGVPLSDEYLALWVPRMEEAANWTDEAYCSSLWDASYCVRCPISCSVRNHAAPARAWLLRPDVVAWKERQKWPKWVTVMTPDGNAPNARRLVACYSQGDWDSFLSPVLATAAEIDAVRRP